MTRRPECGVYRTLPLKRRVRREEVCRARTPLPDLRPRRAQRRRRQPYDETGCVPLGHPALDCGVTPAVAVSLGLGILSALNLRSFEAIDSRARPSAPSVSNWADQQDDTTCDRHSARYDPKGSLLDMTKRNVPGIGSGEVRGGGCKPQEYPKKAEDRS